MDLATLQLQHGLLPGRLPVLNRQLRISALYSPALTVSRVAPARFRQRIHADHAVRRSKVLSADLRRGVANAWKTVIFWCL